MKQYPLNDKHKTEYLESADYITYWCACGSPYSERCRRGPKRKEIIEKLESEGFRCPACAKRKTKNWNNRKDIYG